MEETIIIIVCFVVFYHSVEWRKSPCCAHKSQTASMPSTQQNQWCSGWGNAGERRSPNILLEEPVDDYEGARGGLAPWKTEWPLETPGLRGYTGVSKRPPEITYQIQYILQHYQYHSKHPWSSFLPSLFAQTVVNVRHAISHSIMSRTTRLSKALTAALYNDNRNTSDAPSPVKWLINYMRNFLLGEINDVA